jgi:hypothetical protein
MAIASTSGMITGFTSRLGAKLGVLNPPTLTFRKSETSLTLKATLGRKISYNKISSPMKLLKSAKFPLVTPWRKTYLDGKALKMGNLL